MPQAIDGAEKYFAEVLKPQYYKFFGHPATLRGAFNLATALFHFHEWLYEFHKASLESHLGKSLPSKASLWQHAESIDPNFRYVRDLANASKHVQLTKRSS